jgi:hypothetical protein
MTTEQKKELDWPIHFSGCSRENRFFRLGRQGFGLGVCHNSYLELVSPMETGVGQGGLPKAVVVEIITSV